MAPLATDDSNVNKSSSAFPSSSSSSLPSPFPEGHSNKMIVAPPGADAAANTNNGNKEDNACHPKEVGGAGGSAGVGGAAVGNIKSPVKPDGGSNAKRFLPAYKKPNAALTFPEKMMNLMNYASEMVEKNKQFCVSWLPDGKAFVIYDVKEFTNDVIPKFFKASKFCSFTRKLYRWGFRQLNRGIGPDEPIIFGNEFFQKNNADLMVNMRSITAASIRKRESNLLRHMLASKKKNMLAWDGGAGAGGAAAGAIGGAAGVGGSFNQQELNDLKQYERNLLLSNAFGAAAGQQQQPNSPHQNALLTAAAAGSGVMPHGSAAAAAAAAAAGFGGLGIGLGAGAASAGAGNNNNGGGVGFGGVGAGANGGIMSTDLSNMSNAQLQQLYRNCSASASASGLLPSESMNLGGVGAGTGSINADALSQMGAGGVGAGAGGNLNLPSQLHISNFNGVLPSGLPQDLSNVLPSLSGINNGTLGNPMNNGAIFDNNGGGVGGVGDISGLNGLNGLNSLNGLNGLNGAGRNQMNSAFNNSSSSFPLNFGGNPSANMLQSDLSMFGNNNMASMNKIQPGCNLNMNMNLNLNLQQQMNNNNGSTGAAGRGNNGGIMSGAAAMNAAAAANSNVLANTLDMNGGHGGGGANDIFNNMNHHPSLMNQQYLPGAVPSSTGGLGTDDLSLLYAQQQQQQQQH